MHKPKIYSLLLFPLVDKFNTIDFQTYSPSQVIDNFWTDHNWQEAKINLFDLILLARGNQAMVKNNPGDLDIFLDEFASFMIACYTVHYMNHNGNAIGSYLSEKRSSVLKEEVRIDFLQRLLGIE